MRTGLKHAAALLVLGMASCSATLSRADDITTNNTIVFVCLHGSANSQVAAAHFNQIAIAQGLPFVAVSRGIEVNSSIPTRIRDGLSLDGLTPLNDVPRPLTPDEAGAAVKVVAFDPVPDERRGEAEVNYWSDVPPAIRDYAAARDAIVDHVDNLVTRLAQQSPPRETLSGMITAVDEGKGQITLQVDSGIDSTFKVQDGLIFNAVHRGDHVEITVETIKGTKTIVGLKKL
jgi:protein-tyrosine-phosphatase